MQENNLLDQNTLHPRTNHWFWKVQSWRQFFSLSLKWYPTELVATINLLRNLPNWKRPTSSFTCTLFFFWNLHCHNWKPSATNHLHDFFGIVFEQLMDRESWMGFVPNQQKFAYISLCKSQIFFRKDFKESKLGFNFRKPNLMSGPIICWPSFARPFPLSYLPNCELSASSWNKTDWEISFRINSVSFLFLYSFLFPEACSNQTLEGF